MSAGRNRLKWKMLTAITTASVIAPMCSASAEETNGNWSTSVALEQAGTQKPGETGKRQPTGVKQETRATAGRALRVGESEDQTKPQLRTATEPAASKTGGEPAADDLVRRYCETAGEIADRSRLEQERRDLAAVAAEVEIRIRTLETAVTEHKSWVDKRMAFRASVQDSLVTIYTRMKTEAAAAQIAEMEAAAAAAILFRMEPKVAGLILAEIEPAKAGRIATVLTAVGQLEQSVASQGPKREAP